MASVLKKLSHIGTVEGLREELIGILTDAKWPLDRAQRVVNGFSEAEVHQICRSKGYVAFFERFDAIIQAHVARSNTYYAQHPKRQTLNQRLADVGCLPTELPNIQALQQISDEQVEELLASNDERLVARLAAYIG